MPAKTPEQLDFLHVRTTREVANILGIGRTMVFNLEHQALRKLRARVAKFTNRSGYDILHKTENRATVRFAPANGWLAVTDITNNQGFPIEVICYAFNELRLMHETDYRPDILVSKENSYASAAGVADGRLYIRIWIPKKRSVSRIKNYSFRIQLNYLHGIPVIAFGKVTLQH